MSAKRFTDDQIVEILREADETSIPEVAGKYRVRQKTLYLWRKQFIETQPTHLRVRWLEEENLRLEKAVEELEAEVRFFKGGPAF